MIKIKINKFEELDEGRVDDAKKKYPGQDDLVDKFAAAPGNNKYLFWMMDHSEGTDPDEILDVVKKFDRLTGIGAIKQKDINLYKSFEQLADVVDSTPIPKKEREREGTQKIYEDERFSITRPLNKEASCKLGASTKWCIAATKSRNYFDSYAGNGAAHYFINDKSKSNDDDSHMFAYTFINQNSSTEIYDASDRLVDRAHVAESIGSENETKFYGIMLQEIQKNIKSQITPADVDDQYEKLSELENSTILNQNNLLDDAGTYIHVIFSHDVTPRFAKKHFKKLIDLNNRYVNDYLKKLVRAKESDGRLEAFAAKYIDDDLKSKLYSNIKNTDIAEREKRINVLASVIYTQDNYNRMLKTLRSSTTNKDLIIQTYQAFFPTFNHDEVEGALDIVFNKMDNEQQTNESKLFKFNKDKKIFKLMR